MACRTARTWRKRMAQRCSINTQHHFFFTWCHLEFKVWVVMKLVPYDGVLVKEYVGEILKNFVKFQVVPSSMKVFTTKLNGPLSPICVAAGRGMTRPQQRWHWLAWEKVPIVTFIRVAQHTYIISFSATTFHCISFEVSCGLSEVSNRQSRIAELPRLW